MTWFRGSVVRAVSARVVACAGAVVAVVAAVMLAPTAQANVVERVSVAAGGTQGNYESGAPSLSADGRYVAFVSAADNLVAGDTNGDYDIFVYDRQAHTVRRVSVATGGTQANGDSRAPVISADGKCVAFLSRATNLVAGDTNGKWDVFVHVLATGATTRVSVSTTGVQANGDSTRVSADADGSVVCFTSRATNLVASDTNGVADVFVRDRTASTTTRVSVADDEAQAEHGSDFAGVSGDGRYVAFDSIADNLILGDTNGKWDVFVRDRTAGTTTRASVDSSGGQTIGDSICPSISADGRCVAFESVAGNLVGGDTAGVWDVFVRDLSLGTTERVSVSSAGIQGDDDSDSASVSGDGRYVAFVSQATNLVTGDTNGMGDVFVRDRALGTTERQSVALAGAQGYDDSDSPSLSASAGFVAMESWANNLVGGDTNGAADVFIAEIVIIPVVTLYQQTDRRIGYLGPWSVRTTAFASGGDFYYAGASGASVLISFEGRGITWIAKTGPVYGLAEVSLDGGPPVTVDLYSAAELFQREVYDSGVLTEGPHTLTIKWTGSKNAASLGNFVDIDAVKVTGTLTQASGATRYQEGDTNLSYAGLWTPSASSAASGGSFDFAGSAGATVNVGFKGTYMAWIAKTGPQYGKAGVSLDGGTATIVDLYSATAGYRQCVYNTGIIADTDHTVSITWTGTKSSGATGTYINVDAVDVLGVLTAAPLPTPVAVTYQQTDPRLAYLGTWTSSTSGYASGGSFYFTGRRGSSVTAYFQGTSITVLAKRGPQYGMARISLDGGAKQTVDFYSSYARYQQPVYTVAGLTNGNHTLSIEWPGWKRPAATGNYISLDAVRVVGVLTRMPK